MKEEKPSQLLLSNLETTQESILSCLVGQCDIWFHRIVIVVPRERHPYSIQQNFFVTKEGRLFCEGKPFITTINNEMLDKNKALHRKFARTMKANVIVSTDDYTAYIWNEGRSLTVFYYSIEAAA